MAAIMSDMPLALSASGLSPFEAFIFASIFFRVSGSAPILFAISIALDESICVPISFIFFFMGSGILSAVLPVLSPALFLAAAAIIIAIIPFGALREVSISRAFASSSGLTPAVRQISSSVAKAGLAISFSTKARAGFR